MRHPILGPPPTPYPWWWLCWNPIPRESHAHCIDTLLAWASAESQLRQLIRENRWEQAREQLDTVLVLRIILGKSRSTCLP